MTVRSVEATLRSDEASQRTRALLLAVVALVAMSLTVLTIIGAITDTLGQKTRELGIKMALGGDPRALRWSILRSELAFALLPVAIGVWTAAIVGKTFAAYLVDIQVFDLRLASLVSAITLATVVSSTWILAGRVERLDPASVLRES